MHAYYRWAMPNACGMRQAACCDGARRRLSVVLQSYVAQRCTKPSSARPIVCAALYSWALCAGALATGRLRASRAANMPGPSAAHARALLHADAAAASACTVEELTRGSIALVLGGTSGVVSWLEDLMATNPPCGECMKGCALKAAESFEEVVTCATACASGAGSKDVGDAPTWPASSGTAVSLTLPMGRGRPQAASAAGEADSVTFACDGSNVACRGGVLEWPCSAHCNARSNTGARACLMDLRSSGLNGTLPTTIADLRCAGLLAYMYASAPDCSMPVP